MSTSSSRKPRDTNEVAFSVVQQATGQVPKPTLTAKQAAGSKGGKIGGKRRMDALSETERTRLALMGVAARKAPGSQPGGSKLKKA